MNSYKKENIPMWILEETDQGDYFEKKEDEELTMARIRNFEKKACINLEY